MEKMNKRLSKYALDPDNKKTYQGRAEKWSDYTEKWSDYHKKLLEKAEKSGIIKSQRFNTKSDPMVEIMGSAEKSHPKETEELRKRLQNIGVQLIRPDEETLAYEPSPIPGFPEICKISKGASYSAWIHEVKHAEDDFADGWLGMRVMQNPQKCIEREFAAYQLEIELAEKIGRKDIVKRLEVLRNDEIKKYLPKQH